MATPRAPGEQALLPQPAQSWLETLTDELLSRHCRCPRAAPCRGTQAATLSQSRVILDPSLKGHPSSQTLPETGPQPHFPQSRARMKSVRRKGRSDVRMHPTQKPVPPLGTVVPFTEGPSRALAQSGGGARNTGFRPTPLPPHLPYLLCPSLSHAHCLSPHVLTCKMEGH